VGRIYSFLTTDDHHKTIAFGAKTLEPLVRELLCMRDGGTIPSDDVVTRITCACNVKFTPVGTQAVTLSVENFATAILSGHPPHPPLFTDPMVRDAGAHGLHDLFLAARADELIQQMTSRQAVKDICAQRLTLLELPVTWSMMPSTTETHRREPLDVNGTEAQHALRQWRFHDSCPTRDFEVVRMYRIQHPCKRMQYNLLKYEMDCRADGKGANERLLFHGTDAPTTEAIDANGFNRSFSARAAFGNGVYFARDAIYSANKRYSPPDPANGLLQNLYLARVLVGWSQRGVPGLLSPDCREGNVRPYDSLVDRVDDPGVIVSCHNDNQAYPDYLLQIRSRAREPVARARAFIATFVRNDYHDEWGTPGRLDLSNLGLTDVDLERLVALEPVLTDGSCTILMLSGNTLTRVPCVLLHRRMESLTIPHSVQADCLPASASAWTGMINRQ